MLSLLTKQPLIEPAIPPEQDFLFFPPAGWQAAGAIGVWVTIIVYMVIAWLAYSQLRQLRETGLHEARAFVVVEPHFRGHLVELKISNIGKTVACAVSIDLTSLLESSHGVERVAWQDTALFTEGLPQMAPGQQMRFLLDSLGARSKAGLPMKITGVVRYTARSLGEQEEPFEIDLAAFLHTQTPDKKFKEITDALEKVNKGLTNLTRELNSERPSSERWTSADRTQSKPPLHRRLLNQLR